MQAYQWLASCWASDSMRSRHTSFASHSAGIAPSPQSVPASWTVMAAVRGERFGPEWAEADMRAQTF